MADASSETDATLEDLPELKADLEEVRRLLSRLEDQREETDPDRYERVRQRYEKQLEKLEPIVERLTEQGESRKQELEVRLDRHQEKVQEAKAELEEINQLHEKGAIDEEVYQEDRRHLQQQKKEAKKKASRLERELDEVTFYLTEKGEVSYQKQQLIDGFRRFRERLRMLLGFKRELPGSWIVWGGSAAVLILGILYWTFTGYPEGKYVPPHQDLGMSKEKIKRLNINKYKVEEKYDDIMKMLFVTWKYVPEKEKKRIEKLRGESVIEKSVAVRNGKVISSTVSFYIESDSVAKKVFKKKERDVKSRMKVTNIYNCWREDQFFESGGCAGAVWETDFVWVRLSYDKSEKKDEMSSIQLTAEEPSRH